VALVDVADAVRSGSLADALKLNQLNVEMVPTSSFALRSLASGLLASGDTASAIASYERALAINPNDAQSGLRLPGSSSASVEDARIQPQRVPRRRVRIGWVGVGT
jgi:tetratricopeptide (TPR) repeat protein